MGFPLGGKSNSSNATKKSSSRPLSDVEAAERIEELFSVIDNAMTEKISRIKVEEELEYEKLRVEDYETRRVSVDRKYQRRFKETQKMTDICCALMRLKAKIDFGNACDEIIWDIINVAKARAKKQMDVTKMEKLVVEAAVKLKEREFLIQIRKKDRTTIESSFDIIYKNIIKYTTFDVSFSIHPEYLDEKYNGRIIVYNPSQSIFVVNDMMDKIERTALFLLPPLIRTDSPWKLPSRLPTPAPIPTPSFLSSTPPPSSSRKTSKKCSLGNYLRRMLGLESKSVSYQGDNWKF